MYSDQTNTPIRLTTTVEGFYYTITADNTIMRTYTTTDNADDLPDDATNIKKSPDGKITFMSESGPTDEDTDEPCCDQCAAEQDATPDNLLPDRKTPTGWK